MPKLFYKLFAAGFCQHPQFVTIKGGSWRQHKFPAICALIKHPNHGYILFDTGYNENFFSATKKFPFNIYKRITPVSVNCNNTLKTQLEKFGVKSEQISTIILSHFHADHISGIKDFPNAKIFCRKLAYDFVKNKTGFSALKQGFLKDLLPADFSKKINFVEEKKSIALDQSLAPFESAFDIFGDQSLLVIDLPGHALGQIGIFFYDQNQQPVFLVADSCWSSKAFRELRLPNFISYLIHFHKKSYQQTIKNLHQLHKNNQQIKIIPSHCAEIWQEIKNSHD
ncbi:MAG: MBL fold metallo-hydrolase [Rickettsiales bacterium]|nr:MBL fold metallo-hydrolase [Rickettsiales bacterium]